jgi:hypothetical protein
MEGPNGWILQTLDALTLSAGRSERRDARKEIGMPHGKFPTAAAAAGDAGERDAIGVDGVLTKRFFQRRHDDIELVNGLG